MTSDHRLLILSCSQRKRPDRILLPALERYDGPVFRILRKFLRSCLARESYPEVYILSAQFGLIPAHQLIFNYDCRMTPQRASILQPQVLDQLRHILRNKQYKELFISVGKDYAAALAGYEQLWGEGSGRATGGWHRLPCADGVVVDCHATGLDGLARICLRETVRCNERHMCLHAAGASCGFHPFLTL